MLFTSESVSPSHPDKLCDYIADYLKDYILCKDPFARTAIEVAATTDFVLVMGEVSTIQPLFGIEALVLDAIYKNGYQNYNTSFDPRCVEVLVKLDSQSPDIALKTNVKDNGAGDIGIMFGYACDETDQYLPFTTELSWRITSALHKASKDSDLLYPDIKAQVTVDYDPNGGYRPVTLVVCQSHHDNVSKEELESEVKSIIEPVLNDMGTSLLHFDNFYLNPTGRFVIHGPHGDSGLCLDENTLIYTKQGLRPIKDVRVGQTVYTIDGEAKVIDHFNNGEKDTIEIITDKGHSITATPNHPFYTYSNGFFQWKLTESLNVGDILIRRRFKEITETNNAPDITYFSGRNKVEKHLKFSKDVAYLLGILLGDGVISRDDRLVFYYGNEREMESLSDSLHKVFSKDEIKHYEDSNRFCILSKSLRTQLYEKWGLGYYTASTKQIPKVILESAGNYKREFLSGYFDTDGSIQNNSGRNKDSIDISVVSVSPLLIQQVSDMLWSIGIQSSIVNRVSKEHYSEVIGFVKESVSKELHITGTYSIKLFMDRIGFRYPDKSVKCVSDYKLAKFYNDDIRFRVPELLSELLKDEPYLKDRYSLDKVCDKQAFDTRKKISIEKLTNVLDLTKHLKDTEVYKLLEDLVDNFSFEFVEQLNKTTSNTYDITLDDDSHAFIANGFIVHNTGRKLVVDQYGGYSCIGGGSFSGKDPSKVDLSAALLARYLAKNIVASGISSVCQIQFAYAIGMSQPVSVNVECFGKSNVPEPELSKWIISNFDCSPNGIISRFDLRHEYSHDWTYQEASTGWFHLPHLPWERIDLVDSLKSTFGTF